MRAGRRPVALRSLLVGWRARSPAGPHRWHLPGVGSARRGAQDPVRRAGLHVLGHQGPPVRLRRQREVRARLLRLRPLGVLPRLRPGRAGPGDHRGPAVPARPGQGPRRPAPARRPRVLPRPRRDLRGQRRHGRRTAHLRPAVRSLRPLDAGLRPHRSRRPARPRLLPGRRPGTDADPECPRSRSRPPRSRPRRPGLPASPATRT